MCIKSLCVAFKDLYHPYYYNHYNYYLHMGNRQAGKVQSTVMMRDETDIHETEHDEGVGVRQGWDGMLVWLHTQRLTWPASSLSVGGFLAAPDRCGRGRCCGPPAPACWACSEASQPAAPSSSCVGGSLSSSNTS